MFKNNNKKTQADLRKEAFEEFKKIAQAEIPNGTETLALFRLTPQFSTAPLEDTYDMSVLFRYWSRKGNGAALIEFGQELYDWAKDKGYQHNSFK